MSVDVRPEGLWARVARTVHERPGRVFAASLLAVLDNASAREALDAVNTLTTSLENGGCVG